MSTSRLALALLAIAGCHQPLPDTYSGDLVPQGTPIYHVLPNVAVTIPKNEAPFMVTANGQGAFTIAWTDTSGGPTTFSGTILTNVAFTSVMPDSLVNNASIGSQAEVNYTTGGNRVTLSSAPGTRLDQVTVIAATDPIYLIAYEDSSPVILLLYNDAGDLQQDALSTTPAGFTSP